MIKQYIRNEKGQPFGIIIAEKTEDRGLVFGWSLTHQKDKYNKKIGEQIAMNRLKKCERDQMLVVPSAIVNDLSKFINRAVTYFHMDTESVAVDGYKLAEKTYKKK